MRPKPKMIHEWTEPEKVRIHEARQLFGQAKTALPRILVITLAIEAVLYSCVVTLIPQEIQRELEFSWSRLFRSAFIAAVVLATALYLIMILSTRYFARVYRVRDNGISMIGERGWSVPWKRIEGYSISRHEDLPEIILLMLHTAATKKRILLPEGDYSHQIIATIASRVPLVDVPQDPLERPHLSGCQWFYISLLVLGYLALVAVFPACARYGHYLAVGVLFAPLLFGPGTLGFLTLFGRGCFKNRHFKRYAMTINLITFVLMFLSLFVLGLYLLAHRFPCSGP